MVVMEQDGAMAATGWARALLFPILSVIAITAVLTAVFVLVGPDESDTEVLSAKEGQTASAPATATASPTTKAPTTTPPASSSAPQTSSAPESQTPDPDRPQVVVLNQSAGEGIGAQVADRAREAGWEVFKVGSFRGTVSTTTVYYPSGLRDHAEDLAEDLQGDPRVLERFSNLSGTRLTIVLTDDYGS